MAVHIRMVSIGTCRTVLDFNGEDLVGVGEAVVEVVGARVRGAREGRGGWGQTHKTEPLGLSCDERIAGELGF